MALSCVLPFFFYGFRGIFVNCLIWKQTQFISDPAFNLFCTFIREKSLKHISGHDPFFMSFEPFLLALMVKPDLLASGCRVPQHTLLCGFVPRHSWTVVVWAYFWPSYALPPRCCRWVPPVRPTLYPDQRLSLGISVSGKISLNPPGSCQWTKDHLMHTYYLLNHSHFPSVCWLHLLFASITLTFPCTPFENYDCVLLISRCPVPTHSLMGAGTECTNVCPSGFWSPRASLL